MTTPSPKLSPVRSGLTTIAVLFSVLLVGAAARCGPSTPLTPETLRKESTTIQRADQEGFLRIGIQDGLPLMSEYQEGTGRWIGFDAEIARMLAHELGFTRPEELKFIKITTSDRIPALQGGEVDILVADFTINEERCKYVGCAGPYLITTPEVMIRAADRERIKTIDDLRKVKVCTTGGSTSAKILEKHNIAHSLMTAGQDCADGVRDGTFDAQCTDEVVIAGFVHRFPNELFLLDLPLSDTDTERLGVGVPPEDEALEDLIGHFLKKQWELGEKSLWQAAYNSTLGPALGHKRQPSPVDVPEVVDPDVKAAAYRTSTLGRRRARR